MSDFNRVKEVAKMLFLATPVEPNEEFKFICCHPFTNSTIVGVPGGMADITTESGYEQFKDNIFSIIDSSTRLTDIFMLMNKAYYMTFIKYTEDVLSKEELGEALNCCWILQEFPNADKNVSIKELIYLFRKADKSTLMSEEDNKFYTDLISSKNIVVYRGINRGKVKGLSWTTDIEKAKWFANRWGAKGRVYKMTIKDPSSILACFCGREESEVVVDTSKEKVLEEIKL